MNITSKIILIFLVFTTGISCKKISERSNRLSGISFSSEQSKQIDRVQKIQAAEMALFRFESNESVKSALQTLRGVVASSKDPSIKAQALGILVWALHGMDRKSSEQEKNRFVDTLPQNCVDNTSCKAVVMATTRLIKIGILFEETLFEKYFSSLSDQANRVLISDKLIEIMNLRIEFLKIQTQIYKNLSKPGGNRILSENWHKVKVPRLLNMDKRLEILVSQLKLGGPDFLELCILCSKKLDPNELKIIKEFSNSEAKSVAVFGNQVKVAILYAQRLEKRDPRKWLSELLAKVNRGTITANIALDALMRPEEITGPFGETWLNSLNNLTQYTSKKEPKLNKTILTIHSALSEHRSKHYQALQARYEALDLGKLWPIFVEYEASLSAKYPHFQSLTYQSHKLSNYEYHVAEAFSKVKEGEELPKQLQDQVLGSLKQANEQLWSIPCWYYGYGSLSPKLSRMLNVNRKQLSHFEPDTFREIPEVCQKYNGQKLTKKQLNAKYESISGNSSKLSFFDDKAWYSIWGAVWIEIAISAATAPFILVSGGAAAVAGKAVGQVAARAAFALATRLAIRAAARRTVYVLTRRVITFIADLAVFSLLLRGMMTVAVNGVFVITGQFDKLTMKTFYDTEKSLWDNFKMDILLFGPMLVALPKVALITEKALATIARSKKGFDAIKALSSRALVQEGAVIAAESTTMLTMSMAYEQMEHIMNRNSNDPLLKPLSGSDTLDHGGRLLVLLVMIRGMSRYEWVMAKVPNG